jgi:RNA polymerase sigma-70 factor (ECF subfamily)
VLTQVLNFKFVLTIELFNRVMDYKYTSDAELVSLLNKGNRGAFTEIYDRYNGLLYTFTYKRLQNREEAKDLIHELFFKLWEDHPYIDIKVSISAYLYGALRNNMLKVIARNKVASRYIDSFQHYIDTEPNNNTDHLVRHNELQSFIAGEIANLAPRTRHVFELSRKSNLSRKEIAEELGISEETVKSHMKMALKTLKTKLGPLFILLF